MIAHCPWREPTRVRLVQECRLWCSPRAHAVATLRWRWAGHIALLRERESGRWLSTALVWRDAMYLETLRAVNWRAVNSRASDLTFRRLNREHREGVNRRWDGPIQAVVTASIGEGCRWHGVARCKETRSALEPTFAERVMCRPRACRQAAGSFAPHRAITNGHDARLVSCMPYSWSVAFCVGGDVLCRLSVEAIAYATLGPDSVKSGLKSTRIRQKMDHSGRRGENYLGTLIEQHSVHEVRYGGAAKTCCLLGHRFCRGVCTAA